MFFVRLPIIGHYLLICKRTITASHTIFKQENAILSPASNDYSYQLLILNIYPIYNRRERFTPLLLLSYFPNTLHYKNNLINYPNFMLGSICDGQSKKSRKLMPQIIPFRNIEISGTLSAENQKTAHSSATSIFHFIKYNFLGMYGKIACLIISSLMTSDFFQRVRELQRIAA